MQIYCGHTSGYQGEAAGQVEISQGPVVDGIIQKQVNPGSDGMGRDHLEEIRVPSVLTTLVRLQAYLECRVLGVVRHDEAEVGAIFLEVVVFRHLGCQVLGSNPHLEVAALTAVFHAEVEVALVTDARNGGQHWGRERERMVSGGGRRSMIIDQPPRME